MLVVQNENLLSAKIVETYIFQQPEKANYFMELIQL